MTADGQRGLGPCLSGERFETFTFGARVLTRTIPPTPIGPDCNGPVSQTSPRAGWRCDSPDCGWQIVGMTNKQWEWLQNYVREWAISQEIGSSR